MKRVDVLLGLWVVLSFGTSGCLGETENSGCSTDQDCPDDRICSAARCVNASDADDDEMGADDDDDDADDDDPVQSFTPRDDDDPASDDDEPAPDDDDPALDDDDDVDVPVSGVRDAAADDEDACADVDCDDGLACTIDSCDPSTGTCEYDDEACECRVAADCADEAVPECVVRSCDLSTRTCVTDTMACPCTAASDCEDPDPCSAESCVDFACEATVALGAACDDGIACTSSDTCQADGSCSGDESGCNVEPPPGWSCSGIFYGDGDCDCGCGALDVDCPNATVQVCAFCDSIGSCADSCADIESSNNATCGSMVPPGWSCDPSWYGDLECDCGCGVTDVDCPSALASACQFCNLPGSCAESETDCSSIDASDNSSCTAGPPGWTCVESFYGDGDCDCGCGVPDVDCTDGLSLSCDFCFCTGAIDDCSVIQPLNNHSCGASWDCDPATFDDGAICDCGCGNFDPDCASALPLACDACGDAGSCANANCVGLSPSANALCSIPSEWSCNPSWWGDGDCDCGCGSVDIDCADSLPASCDFCGLEGSCADAECTNLEETDNSVCVETAWTCDPEWLGDLICDCGCGALDVDCEGPLVDACELCWCGASAADCSAIDPSDNGICLSGAWTCDPSFQGDGLLCDCGCGDTDPDCTSALPSACDYCGIPGSCADPECVGLDPSNNALCVAP